MGKPKLSPVDGHSLSPEFIAALQEQWEQNGAAAFVDLMTVDPISYVEAVINLVYGKTGVEVFNDLPPIVVFELVSLISGCHVPTDPNGGIISQGSEAWH